MFLDGITRDSGADPGRPNPTLCLARTSQRIAREVDQAAWSLSDSGLLVVRVGDHQLAATQTTMP